MGKTKIKYKCIQCGEFTSKWQGQCPNCNQWNTLVEQEIEETNSRYQSWNNKSNFVDDLSKIKYVENDRLKTKISELDRVLGGGLVSGSVILLGGDPGIGKSTLFLQLLDQLSSQKINAVYVTGEESIEQIALRAKRLNLGLKGIKVLAEINVNSILKALSNILPKVVVIDSIQTVYLNDINSSPGSITQVRESAAELTRFAKQNSVILLIVGHVTKDGLIAGPRVLEHMVDTVLYFEGDNNSNYRMIRAIKNRYGAVNELGVFAMLENGLKCIVNPSAIFLSSFNSNVSGSCILVSQEGSRPLLVEIQSLVDDSQAVNSKRLTIGLEQNRLSMLLAVLHKHSRINFYNKDIFVNVVGGIKIVETAADLAVILSCFSSFKNIPLSNKLAVFGEVGLSGEIRPVSKGLDRIRECYKLGFKEVIVPKANLSKKIQEFKNIKITPVSNLKDLIDIFS